MKNKIGLGIITCNRESFFLECFNSAPDADEVIIINDGKPYENFKPNPSVQLIQHTKNKGVGKSKNEALRFLMNKGCEHLFLMEDDIKIINKNIMNIYIETARKTGLSHLNFAYHGPENKNADGLPNPRTFADCSNGITISLNKHIFGAFSYYNRKIIEKVGYMDERYINALEHVEHTWRIIKAGGHPPFWWFADVADSYNYIEDVDPARAGSVIRKNKLYFKFIVRYNNFLFKKKYGISVMEIPDCSEEEMRKSLEQIQNNNDKL